MALANHLAEKGNTIKIWSFTQEEKDLINNEHKCMFIPEMKVNEKIKCSNDIKKVAENADLIIHVTPSKFTKDTLKTYKDYIQKDTIIVICSKGFGVNSKNDYVTLDEIFEEEIPNVKLAVLSGPSYATEVIKHIPTAVTVASKSTEVLDKVSETFSNEYFRVYKSNDVKGVLIGGALKNIVAFCAGVCTELGFGTNAISALITRGLAEIARLGEKMGASKETFYGLSGLGDLILTCSSDESRNRRAGRLIGKGYTIEQAQKEIGMTIESIDNINIAKSLAIKYNVDMPIVENTYDVLYNGVNIKDVCKKLMTRSLKYENDFNRK